MLAEEKSTRINVLEADLKHQRVALELDKYKSLHDQWKEYERQLFKEKQRTDTWLQGFTESATQGRCHLQQMIKSLSEELESVKRLGHRSNSPAVSEKWDAGGEGRSLFVESIDRQVVQSGRGPGVDGNGAGSVDGNGAGSGNGNGARSKSGNGAGESGGSGESVVASDGELSTAALGGSPRGGKEQPSSRGQLANNQNSGASQQPSISAPASVGSNPLLVEITNKLLQAQTEMLCAQAQAVVVQGLPAISMFSGESKDPEEDGFDRWLEAFRSVLI